MKNDVCYVLWYVPGPRWVPDTPVSSQPLAAHQVYMAEQFAQGKVLMGGPLLDNAGGLIILSVSDQPAARQIMEHDPAIAAGVVKGSVHPWLPQLWHAPPGPVSHTQKV
jgi:uncharacterized protein YciI